MGDVGDYYRDIAPYLKEGRKKSKGWCSRKNQSLLYQKQDHI
ncbi:TPA: hypothetical protein ACT1UU_003501 [Klebsiella oxytoca]